MLKEFLKKTSIGLLLGKVRMGGQTIAEHLKQNRINTKTSFTDTFKRAVMGDAPLEQVIDQLGKVSKRRKRQTLTTLKNVMSAIRGQARATVVGRRKGRWFNQGVLDSGTTERCLHYMTASWDLPYSEIPERPPRVQIIPHPCRSILVFRTDSQEPPEQTPFMEQFNSDEDLQRELLGKTRFEAYKKGELPINTFSQYEKSVLLTLDELGL